MTSSIKKIHYQTDVLERFIPVSIEMLIADLVNSSTLTPDQNFAFEQFANNYIALFHANTHKKLRHLKNIYQPFNPDLDTLISEPIDTKNQLSQLKKELYSILDSANYEKISEASLNEALNKISPHGVKVSVDFEAFAEVSLFYRGSALHTESRRNWKRLQFKKKPTEVQVYRRLFVLLQPKSRQQWIDHLRKQKQLSLKKATKHVNAALKILGVSGEEDIVYIKLFKDIPRADLEMLFPNTRVQIRLFDKIKLGVLGGGGTAGGVMAMVTKLSVAIDPFNAVLAIGGLLGVIWRQIAKVFSQRAKYSAILTKNLYFYNLNNNMGSLEYIIASAESEECKEALLAYFFLLKKGKTSRQTLDESIEEYIYKQYSIPMNFEIDDGLSKLQQSQLLTQYNDTICAVNLEKANESLIQQWNQLFTSNNTAPISEE